MLTNSCFYGSWSTDFKEVIQLSRCVPEATLKETAAMECEAPPYLSNRKLKLLSDDKTNKYRPTGKRRSVEKKGFRWSDSQKIEAVQTYLILGSLKLTAGALKIPFDTLKLWKSSQWWKDLIEELRIQDDLQLSNRLKKIISRSYDVLEDRLEHGDFVFDQKTGEMRRKPVSMRDATKVAVDLSETRQELVDRHLGGQSVTEDKIEKTLNELAQKFAEIANQVQKKPSMEVTDVIFGQETGDAKNEERET